MRIAVGPSARREKKGGWNDALSQVAERHNTNFSQVSVGQIAHLIYVYSIGLKCWNIFVETDRMQPIRDPQRHSPYRLCFSCSKSSATSGLIMLIFKHPSSTATWG
jgi:hypothetical protein